MARLNIYSASCFTFSNHTRNLSSEHIALIPDADQLIHLSYTRFSQSDLDQHVFRIRIGRAGSWFQQHYEWSQKSDFCQGDLPLARPQVNVSAALQEIDSSREMDSGPKAEELAYVLIIQGKTGATRAKLLIESDLDRAQAAIMYEAINGYTVAFSAAILKKNVSRLHDTWVSLIVVGTREELTPVDGDGGSARFWC